MRLEKLCEIAYFIYFKKITAWKWFAGKEIFIIYISATIMENLVELILFFVVENLIKYLGI